MPPLIALAIQELPGIIGFLKEAFRDRHPDEPEPTNEDVLAAYKTAFESSIAKDDAWLAAHPKV